MSHSTDNTRASASGSGSRPALIAGRYELRALLGEGGMGSVYLAWDRVLSEQVALKSLKPDHHQVQAAADRLVAEVRIARRVTHPNVARTFDVGLHDGVPFLTMEYVDGEDLADVAAREAHMTLERLLQIALPVCEGLRAAHAVGVIHHDLKPPNVIVGKDGRVVLTDFGIARALRSDGRLTGDRDMLGTPAYMAPEQVTGEPEADQRADIYALGILLFELWSGRLPFDGDTAMALAMARIHRKPRRLSETCSSAPEALSAVIDRCLERDPEKRYPDVGAVITALDALQRHPAGARTQPLARLAAAPAPNTREVASAGPATLASQRVTVAVLPFRHAGPEDDALRAEGLTEDIIDLLSTNDRLFVRPHSAVARAVEPGRDPVRMGRELGVQAVVDGSLRGTGDRLQARVKLLSTSDGFQVWAGRFEGTTADLFSMSEEAARGVGTALAAGKLGVATADPEAVSPEAVDLYLRARHQMHASWFGDMQPALELFKRALELAPSDGRILSAAALAFARASFINMDGNLTHLTEAERLARRAVQLVPSRPDPYIALARVHYERLEVSQALANVERAVQLAPSSELAHEFLGRILRETGPLDRALSHLRTAMALNPQSASTLHDLVMGLALEGRWDDVDTLLAATPENETLRLAREGERSRTDLWRTTPRWVPEKLPETPPSGILAVSSYLRWELMLTGRLSPEHEAWMDTGIERTVRTTRMRLLVHQLRTETYLRAGLRDRALTELDRTVEAGLYDLMWLTHCPLFAPLRGDARFTAALEKVSERAGQA